MQKQTKVYFDEELNCCYAFSSDGSKFLFDSCDAGIVSSLKVGI